MSTQPLEVFISYSHKDEDLKDELAVHLASLIREEKIKPWQDRDIEGGEEWDDEIRKNLEAAKIILLLITPRFLASRYCFDEETKRALERHKAGTARVIPVIMKPSDWQTSPFSKLQVLPKDGKPVTRWDDQDEAFVNVVQGIRRVVTSMQKVGGPAVAAATGNSPSTPSPALPLSPQPEAPLNPFQKRLKLNKLLASLPGPQFEQIIFALRPPAGNVPSAASPQGQRVAALLEWAESPIGCGLDNLEYVLSEIVAG